MRTRSRSTLNGSAHPARRVGLAAGALVLASTVLLPAAPAGAGPTGIDGVNDASLLAASRIARSLEKGDHLGKHGGWSTRAEQTAALDMFHALRRVGVYPRYRAGILTAFEQPQQFWRYTGAGRTRHAGAVSKLLYAVATTNRTVATYADGDLKRDLQAMVVSRRSSPQYGRAVDSGPTDHSDTATQSWAVRALAASGGTRLPMATRFLLRQQCDRGYFREFMDDADYACPDSLDNHMVANVDATALAVLALQEARDAGVRNLTDDIRAASRWLVRRQSWTGGYYTGGSYNVASTALATEALLRTGRPGAAANSAAWILRKQITSTTVRSAPGLRRLAGAIAYDRSAVRKARAHGLGRADGSRWARSTAQGALGLPALLRATRVDVVAPDHAKPGTKVRVKVRGLLGGERFEVRTKGRVVVRGRVGRGGVAVVTVRMPSRPGRVVLEAAGSRASRDGATVVRVTGKR